MRKKSKLEQTQGEDKSTVCPTLWCLTHKKIDNDDVSELEKEIDQIVYRLYCLTKEGSGVGEGGGIGGGLCPDRVERINPSRR
jgi:hypothetical protein